MKKTSRTLLVVRSAAMLVSAGLFPVVSRAATLYSSGGFESSVGFVPGVLHNQTAGMPAAWKVRTSNSGPGGISQAIVQGSTVYAGDQSVEVTRLLTDSDTYYAPVTVSNPQPITLSTQYVDVSWSENVMAGAQLSPLFGVYAMDGTTPIGYAGVDANTGQIQYSGPGGALMTVQNPFGVVAPVGTWNNFTLQLDFPGQVETVFLNNVAVASTPFISSAATSFSDADLASIGSNLSEAGVGSVFYDNYSVVTTDTAFNPPANLTWNNSGSNSGTSGQPLTWDLGNSTNFSNGIGPAAFNNGDNVVFNDSNNGNYAVVISGQVSPGSVLVANNGSTYTFTGSGGISGLGALTKAGTGNLIISTANTYTGDTIVTGGTLTLASANAFPAGTNLNVSQAATVVVAPHLTNPIVVIDAHSLTNTGLIDLGNNDMIVEDSSELGAVWTQVGRAYNGGAWNGIAGITSSAAAQNTMHITALGVILNDNGSGTPLYGTSGALGLFDGANPALDDVLVKYTYYGDANLDGHVDASDYTRIDNGSINQLTGWFNGDFNYDGVVNGSDYTLIDNSYNTQGASLEASIGSPDAATTAQIAAGVPAAAVPEPGTFGLTAAGLLLFKRRPDRRLAKTSSK